MMTEKKHFNDRETVGGCAESRDEIAEARPIRSFLSSLVYVRVIFFYSFLFVRSIIFCRCFFLNKAPSGLIMDKL